MIHPGNSGQWPPNVTFPSYRQTLADAVCHRGKDLSDVSGKGHCGVDISSTACVHPHKGSPEHQGCGGHKCWVPTTQCGEGCLVVMLTTHEYLPGLDARHAGPLSQPHGSSCWLPSLSGACGAEKLNHQQGAPLTSDSTVSSETQTGHTATHTVTHIPHTHSHTCSLLPTELACPGRPVTMTAGCAHSNGWSSAPQELDLEPWPGDMKP